MLVVLGAGATQARPLVPGEASVVIAEEWAAGIGASLHRGLAAAATTTATAALISLVDLPGLPVPVVSRVLGFAPVGPESMLRAGYGGRPGHPVLLGRNHWQPLRDTGTPDRAAGPYLRDHDAPWSSARTCGTAPTSTAPVPDPPAHSTVEELVTPAGRELVRGRSAHRTGRLLPCPPVATR